jgi:cation:H+ antiporter
VTSAQAIMGLQLLGGLVYLLVAGDLLVRGAVALAKRANIPPLVVGLTIVGFGTSAPELFVSVGSVLRGHSDVAIGNVVGSNIANVLLVLGIPALIYPTTCDRRALRVDCLLVVMTSAAFLWLCHQGPLGFGEGALLFLAILPILWRSARSGGADELGSVTMEHELERVLGLPRRLPMILLFVTLGMVGLPLGAHILVDGAVQIAAAYQVSSALVGLTVIAIGTSLPELATTLVAALHRNSDVALGNVVGSNLFNLLAIMGIAAMAAPNGIPIPPSFLSFDLLVMLGSAFVLAYFTLLRGSIGRLSGAGLLTAYLVYLTLVIQKAAPVASGAR